MKILIIEDDSDLSRVLQKEFSKTYQVDVALNGVAGGTKALEKEYDLIILDYYLPDINGGKVVELLRREHIDTPILMLTAHTQTDGIVECLDMGADDYVTKPFTIEELRARIRALFRRTTQNSEDVVLQFGKIEMNIASRVVRVDGKIVSLRKKEYELLEFFMRHQKVSLSRYQIMEGVWEDRGDKVSNTVDVHVKMLRDRIEKPFGVSYIRTITGVGYILSDEEI